jgi:hypothetical protein
MRMVMYRRKLPLIVYKIKYWRLKRDVDITYWWAMLFSLKRRDAPLKRKQHCPPVMKKTLLPFVETHDPSRIDAEPSFGKATSYVTRSST